ncbi:MAG: hypothetical protein IJY03_09650 [Prevotella sp.]|nr:hypothetical protein [Prevotella sp.]
MKITGKILILMLLLMYSSEGKSQRFDGWAHFGSTINQELRQDGMSVKSSFCPEVELGVRGTGESKIAGFGLSANFRWVNTEKIEWFDDSKFIWDLYIGPSFFIPFDGFESTTGLMINPFIGYSTSAAWFDPDVKSGSFSIKISADLMFHGFSVGVFYRPMKQKIESKDVSSKGGEYMRFGEFESAPSFGLRIGYVFGDKD